MAHFTSLNMRGKYLSYSPFLYAWLLFIMLVIISVYCFSKPLVLSIDSAYGFLAYKGTLFYHSFNTLQDISTEDIGKVNHIYMSWWSPGQWIFPGLLNYFFGTRLGVASICVTLVSLISGLFGYYRVFKFFRFSTVISLLSLLIIFSSSSLYYSFIIYQGGEILEFACFPWFLLYVIRIRQISVWNLLGITFLFFLCFIAKTTLLVYCTLVLAAKVFFLSKSSSNGGFRFSFKNLLLLFPAILLIILTSVFYLSRGPHPSLVNHFIISVEGLLVSLSSPLNSILSIQQWIERITKTLQGSLHGSIMAETLYYGFYLVVIIVQSWIISSLFLNNKTDRTYKNLFLILFGGISAFFIFAYSFNTNIDFSSRHFKLMGYLFVPGLLSVFCDKIRQSWIHITVVLFCMICISDVFYLKEKWIRDRYIGTQYFYRNCEQLPNQDKLDKESYYKLLDFDRIFTGNAIPVVFFIESSADIAIDIHHPFILQRPGEDIRNKVYHHSEPDLLVCISKSTVQKETDILQIKFPDYGDFDLISETNKYLFFLGKTHK
jgi:hypothetical protein